MVTVDMLSKKYGSHWAVKDVSFTLPQGKIIGLLGQNGAGKTTILNMITGYIGPTQGSISIAGVDLFKNPRQAKRHVGYLPEQPPLYEEMTVKDYLYFCCSIKEVEKKAISAHVQEIAITTGIEDVMGRLIAHLSKGYRQRVGFAQALCGAPQVLILDEPTVGLDPKQLAQIRGLIKSLGKKHTVLFSSHILQEVQTLCEEVLILHKGQLIKKVIPSDIDHSKNKIILLQLSAAIAPDRLLPALQSLSAVQRVFPGHSCNANVTTVTLECKAENEPQRQLFTLLSGLNAPILHLIPQEDSLEEVFLRVVSQADAKEMEKAK